MTTCNDLQAHLVDETQRPPLEWETHFASCLDCQAFRRAHFAALQLRGASARSARRVNRSAIARRAGILGAFALVVTGAVGLVWVPLATQATQLTEPLAVEQPVQLIDDDASWAELLALQAKNDAALKTNPVTTDASYQPFGELPDWLAPRPVHPLEAVGTALSPIAFMQR